MWKWKLEYEDYDGQKTQKVLDEADYIDPLQSVFTVAYNIDTVLLHLQVTLEGSRWNWAICPDGSLSSF